MELNPLISIIVPVYNAERYIHRCIDSVLSQTYHNFEILLINDGTPDNSGEICDAYAIEDSRVSVFHKKNGGVSSARNLGLDHAKGDWIAFLDSDDFVKQEWLMDYVCEIRRELGVGLIFQGIIKLKDGVECERKPLKSGVVVESDFATAYLYLDREVEIFGYTVSKIYRADVFRQNSLRYNENICFCEDLELTFYFLQRVNKISIINRFNYVYTVDRYASLSWINHSFDELSYIADMSNDQLILLSRRVGGASASLFDSVHGYRFRALKKLYKLSESKSAKERRRIIELYHSCYYHSISNMKFYRGEEWLILHILSLGNARLIDLIYRVLFGLKAELGKISFRG